MSNYTFVLSEADAAVVGQLVAGILEKYIKDQTLVEPKTHKHEWLKGLGHEDREAVFRAKPHLRHGWTEEPVAVDPSDPKEVTKTWLRTKTPAEREKLFAENPKLKATWAD